MAEESGLKTSAVYDIEAGRNNSPGYTVVMRLVKALQRGGLPGLKPEDVFPVPDAEAKAAPVPDAEVKAAS